MRALACSSSALDDDPLVMLYRNLHFNAKKYGCEL